MHTGKKGSKTTKNTKKLVVFKLDGEDYSKLANLAKENQRSLSAQVRWIISQLDAV